MRTQREIAARASGDTGMAANAFSGSGGITVYGKMGRAAVFAEGAFWWAFVSFSLGKGVGKGRHHGEDGAHGAEELAEEAFLNAHSNENEDENVQADSVGFWRQFSFH